MENTDYINDKLIPLLEELTVQLLLDKPEDPVPTMLNYLRERGGYTSNGLTFEEKRELESLRRNITAFRQKRKEERINNPTIENSDSSEEDDSDNELEIKKQKILKKEGRKGISAEAYGKFNTKQPFVPKVIKKTQDQIERIKGRIISSFIFNNLENNDIRIIIDAMEEKIYQPNEFVVKQGEKGDNLYVVEQGELECFKKFKEGEPPKHLKTYYAGESFGELALFYNSTRMATIKTRTKCILWSLDRETFNNIVKDATVSKRKKYETFLKSVEILSSVEPYELTQICDSIKVCCYKKNEYIIKEGEAGDIFYIIEEGTAAAYKQLKKDGPPDKLLEYKRGSYFGELALLDGGPRKASIMATSDVKLLSIDRVTFKRLLGPLENILKRNSEKYKQYIKK